MLDVEKEPGGDLRNSLYRQQTRSARRLTRTRLALYTLLAPVAIFIGRTIWRWCASVQVVGAEHIPAALERASSSHTGARALRDYYQALAHEGISPAITPDGPRGPPRKFKPGAILLAQMSQRPMIPMAYAASRAWRIQWDSFVIPKPFARIAIVIGPPVYVRKGLDAPGLLRIQAEMEENLGALYGQALMLIK
jgi:1-acyl-sn-glycerol-3-phosphate acyltransferase